VSQGSIDAPRVLIAEADIRRRVAELAERISRDYADRGEIVLVGVLKGAFIFLADLSRRLAIPRTIEFMALSSYGARGAESGAVRVILDLRTGIEGRHVLVVEDIVDTGRTLHYLMDLLRTRDPASVKTCALVRKKDRHEVEVPIDYLGFDIPDEWVVGYGLDYKEQYRTLPYIGVVNVEGTR
jgi:hypoxanthine phosphoribosyltransferase